MSARASSNEAKSQSEKGISEKIENDIDLVRVRLANNLQSTLILDQAIELFFASLQKLLNCSGMRYVNEHADICISFGGHADHKANYAISSSKEKLGELTVFREHTFKEAELAVLEMLIGVLFYPLRNALLYREALECSLKDSLTGVGNRAALDFALPREVKLAKRHGTALSVLMLDIDHFKQVNDTLGHSFGDTVIRNVASTIRDALRETDQVFRYGGEEFLVLLHESSIQNAYLSAERIRKSIESSVVSKGEKCHAVTVSIGVAAHLKKDSEQSLVERADKALYAAKAQGRNCVVKGTEHALKSHQRSAQGVA